MSHDFDTLIYPCYLLLTEDYPTYDFRGSTRTPNNIYNIHVQNCTPLRKAAFHEYVYSSALNGITYHFEKKNWDKVSAVDRVKKYMETSIPFILWLGNHLLKGEKRDSVKLLLPAPVIAEIYASYLEFQDQLIELQEFWLAVLNGINLDPTSPAAMAHEFLATTLMKQSALQKEIDAINNYEQRRFVLRVSVVAHFNGDTFETYEDFLSKCPVKGDDPKSAWDLPQYPE